MSSKLDVVLGLQWGDEGKGKIVDVLAGRYPAVARFQGGPNAGHSLHFDGKSFVVRSIPSGIFREGSVNIIGSGVRQCFRYGNRTQGEDSHIQEGASYPSYPQAS